jgi:hypothetical protein
LRDSDEWYIASLIVVSGFLVGIFTISDQDIAFALKVDVDMIVVAVYLIWSLAFFILIRKRVNFQEQKENAKTALLQKMGM